MLRLIIGAVGAVPVTLALFFLMRGLITVPLEKPEEGPEADKIEIAREERDESTRTKDNTQRPKQTEAPPPPKITRSKTPPKQDSIAVNIGNVGVDINANGNFRSSSDVQPIVRVNPQYPPRAAERAIEGWVHLRFTVTETGSVTDVVVIDSDPPGIFDRAAIRAVEKWKYKPMLEGGKPVSWPQEVVLSFDLADE